jgi:hypothetical protein
MPEYRYELRRGDEMIAAGHLSSEQPFEVGRADYDRQPGRGSCARSNRRLVSANSASLCNYGATTSRRRKRKPAGWRRGCRYTGREYVARRRQLT